LRASRLISCRDGEFPGHATLAIANECRNFIFNKKYSTKDPGKYELLEVRSHQWQSHYGYGHGMGYTAQSFLDEGTEYLRNEMYQRFSRLSHHFFGEEEHGRPRRSHEGPGGQQIQLTRRYVVVHPGYLFGNSLFQRLQLVSGYQDRTLDC